MMPFVLEISLRSFVVSIHMHRDLYKFCPSNELDYHNYFTQSVLPRNPEMPASADINQNVIYLK